MESQFVCGFKKATVMFDMALSPEISGRGWVEALIL